VEQGVGRVGPLDTLRGLSALAVCWFHFSGNRLVGTGPIRQSGAYGWLGVEVFFVISGFVIPFALQRSGYRLNNYRTFLFKRLARLYPPYLASVAVAFGLLVIYSQYKAQSRVDFNSEDLLLHLAFLNDFFGKSWLNSIYWSLAIEVQFYLVIGLLFPLLFSEGLVRRYLGYAIFALPVIALPSSIFLFHYAFLFLMGVVTLQYSNGLLRRFEYAVLMSVFGFGVLLLMVLPALIAALFAVAAIIFIKRGFAPLDSLGKVSYSFYLLHSSIGSLILFLLLRFVFHDSEVEKLLALVISIAATIGVATIAYYLIERPAINSSAQIRYGRRQPVVADSPSIDMQAVEGLIPLSDQQNERLLFD
jgi:peptidoglycan/LPS O-acetylase OafA/YrhL